MDAYNRSKNYTTVVQASYSPTEGIFMSATSKIAVLCLSHFRGGMELDALKQTKLFRNQDIDAMLICREGTFLEQVAEEQNVPAQSIKFKSKLSISLIRGLREAIREHDIDTLIFFGASEIKSIYFAVMGLNCRVIVRHGTTKSSSKKDPIHRLFYSCVSDYVGISQHLSKNVLKILPSNEKNVHTIYNSPAFDGTEYNKNAPLTFLHVGRVEEGKGVLDAVKALCNASIPSDSKVITYVGDVDKSQIKEEIEEIAEKGDVKVIFKGFCSNVTPFYKENSFLLFPSYGEGLPNVMLEAISKGLSCITYDNTVFPEFSHLGFQGVYSAADKDIDALARMIEKAYEERQNLNLEDNMVLFDNIFSTDCNVKNWLGLING
ncbi:glycosyltransferase [Enterovibrio sp. ZSDZ35]|uniref:Glycosyltransferase n=1 Tax=Enterovibrio qingdaonensis TaxID=2899818 RepID=A0ABT5QM47_9GAMM|nr:glycosyltransferase [Enterovibrio sp. ZSDZ35]MDD1782060.1 glycosyltransferase [Enterovibrio sp. ZSDZ35]